MIAADMALTHSWVIGANGANAPTHLDENGRNPAFRGSVRCDKWAIYSGIPLTAKPPWRSRSGNFVNKKRPSVLFSTQSLRFAAVVVRRVFVGGVGGFQRLDWLVSRTGGGIHGLFLAQGLYFFSPARKVGQPVSLGNLISKIRSGEK